MPMNSKSIDYDLPTAVTFLVAGLALGWMLRYVFSPVVGGESAPRWSVSKPLPIANEVLFE